jgi:hypothetical protein
MRPHTASAATQKSHSKVTQPLLRTQSHTASAAHSKLHCLCCALKVALPLLRTQSYTASAAYSKSHCLCCALKVTLPLLRTQSHTASAAHSKSNSLCCALKVTLPLLRTQSHTASAATQRWHFIRSRFQVKPATLPIFINFFPSSVVEEFDGAPSQSGSSMITNLGSALFCLRSFFYTFTRP